MACQGLFSTFLISAPPRVSLPLTRNGSKISASTKPVQCITTPSTTIDVHDQGSGGSRRNANYPPSFWDYNLVKSLSSIDYTVLILTQSQRGSKNHRFYGIKRLNVIN